MELQIKYYLSHNNTTSTMFKQQITMASLWIRCNVLYKQQIFLKPPALRLDIKQRFKNCSIVIINLQENQVNYHRYVWDADWKTTIDVLQVEARCEC